MRKGFNIEEPGSLERVLIQLQKLAEQTCRFADFHCH